MSKLLMLAIAVLLVAMFVPSPFWIVAVAYWLVIGLIVVGVLRWLW